MRFDAIVLSDHVAPTSEVTDVYPPPFYGPLTAIAWLAGQSEDLLFATSVLVVPYRHPLLTARVSAMLYEISGGRFALGVGVGWSATEFEALGAKLYGVSCDTTYTLTAFRQKIGVSIEQLSDFEPKGETCRAFGVYHRKGFPRRALVIIGPDGVVKWSYQARHTGELPGANLIFDGLGAAAAASPAD